MLEIERRYLACRDDYPREVSHHRRIRQGYLVIDEQATVRVRITDEEARLTIEGSSTANGLVRPEWEYPIPVADAEETLSQYASHRLEKVRYYVPYGGFVWEMGCPGKRLKGLVMAEVELTSPTDCPALPLRLGCEVTDDTRYYNTMLAQEPASLPTTRDCYKSQRSHSPADKIVQTLQKG